MTRHESLRALTLLVLAGLLVTGAWVGGVAAASEPLRVVTSTTDLGSIAAAVGGDRVIVSAICRPAGDPHRVEVLPSYMVRVTKARLYVKVGLGLDAWADAIIDGSHNGKLTVVDGSAGVAVLEKPTGKVDASMGDVHPEGNPHYWLDPTNAAVVATHLAEEFGRLDPGRADEFAARARTFGERAAALRTDGRATTAGLASRAILTYHRSWSYFAHAFGLDVPSTVEPVPGIPPTGRHLAELVTLARERGVRVLLQEPYFSADAGKFLAREAGIHPVTLSASCDDVTPDSYFHHMDAALAAIAGAGK